MAKQSSKNVVEVIVPTPAPALPPAILGRDSMGLVANDLAGALGYGFDINGFPQNQGFPGSEQISNATSAFKNLRWYLVSNFRQLLNQLYVEIGLVQTICDVPVDDALRGGIKIKTKQLDEEEIEKIQVSIDRDNDLGTAGQAAKWNRLFGGAGILILTDQDPEDPLDLDALGEDDPLEFRAVDMWELFWDKQNTEGYDPSTQTEDFEYYSYYGVQVHKSRVMKLKGLEAPSFIRPRLRGWGFSVVEGLVRSLNQYFKGTDVLYEVLDEYKVDVFKIKNLVNTLLSPGGEEKVKRRIGLAAWQKNYQNALTMDSEDDWDHKQLSFAGLGETLEQIRMQVASDMRMPLTKLFGISAAGFNSGEDDLEVYNSMVESQVRSKIKYQILRMVEIKCMKFFGFIPDDISIEFAPLRMMSAEQEENVKTQKFNRLVQSLQVGAIDLKFFHEASNRGGLFDLQMENVQGLLNPDGVDQPDVAKDDGDDKDEDTDDPGSDRADTQKSKAMMKGGVPKGGGKQPSEKPDPKETKTANWDESDHPRDGDGQFSAGGGSSVKAEFKKRYPSAGAFHSSASRTEAITLAKKMRTEGIHASIFHISGPRTGSKSVYAIAVPESTRNGTGGLVVVAPSRNAIALIRRYSTIQRIGRILQNSAAYDRAAYEADGGDKWIDPRRHELFKDPPNVDKTLWAKAKAASKASLGEERWQFVVWIYKKLGGRF